jgi:antirestriction protein
MERPTFEAMLEAATGVERDRSEYTVAEDYTLSVYIGKPGQAMEISEVTKLKLEAAFCAATSREHSTVYYVEYSSLHGLCVRPPSGGGGRRAGFS